MGQNPVCNRACAERPAGGQAGGAAKRLPAAGTGGPPAPHAAPPLLLPAGKAA